MFERKGPPVEAALLVERDQPGAKLRECDLRNGEGVGYTTCSDLDDLARDNLTNWIVAIDQS